MLDEEHLVQHFLNIRPHEGFTFVLGSGLTMPVVPGAEGIVDLVQRQFAGSDTYDQIEAELKQSGVNRYQTAIERLETEHGRAHVNSLIFNTVLEAADLSLNETGIHRLPEDQIHAWALTPAVESLGNLIVKYGERFGKDVLTTNFDPLIEVGIRRAGGDYVRMGIDQDGSLHAIHSTVCRVIHLHGFYHSADTLHTSRQLRSNRPKLERSLERILRERTIVVMGYGGWDDIFTKALMNAVDRGGGSSGKLLWCFYENSPVEILNSYEHAIELLQPGIERGQVQLYKGIDIHTALPRIEQELEQADAMYFSCLQNVLFRALGVNSTHADSLKQEIESFNPGWEDQIKAAFEFSDNEKNHIVERIKLNATDGDYEMAVADAIDDLFVKRCRVGDVLSGLYTTVWSVGVSAREAESATLRFEDIMMGKAVPENEIILITKLAHKWWQSQLEQRQGPFYDALEDFVKHGAMTISKEEVLSCLAELRVFVDTYQITDDEKEDVFTSLATMFEHQVRSRSGEFYDAVRHVLRD